MMVINSFKNDVEFNKIIQSRAAELKSQGLQPNQMIGLLNHNTVQFFVDFFAIQKLDSCVFPVAQEHLGRDFMDGWINPKNIFIRSEGKNNLLNGWGPLLLLSSGTSGEQKIIEINHSRMQNRLGCYREIYSESVKNVLCFLPTSFGHGLIANALGPFFCEKRIFISSKFDLGMAARFFQILKANQIDAFSCVPTHLRLLKKVVQQFGKEKVYDQPIEIHCASAPLLEADYQFIQQAFPKAVLKYHFGMTELGSWISQKEYRVQSDSFTVGDVGQTFGVTFELNLDKQLNVRLSEPLRHYSIQSKTVQTWSAGDCFNTLDVAQIENGNLVILGRDSDFINKAGLKISPTVIEECLRKLDPQIKAYAVSMASSTNGEDVALILIKEAPDQITLTATTVNEHLKKSLPHEYWPKAIFYSEDIFPETNGKLPRSEMRRWVKGQH